MVNDWTPPKTIKTSNHSDIQHFSGNLFLCDTGLRKLDACTKAKEKIIIMRIMISQGTY